MKKLVVLPSDPIEDYLKAGRSYDYLENYYNPQGYFDEVYSLSVWGGEEYRRGKMIYRSCKPSEFQRAIIEIQPDVIRAYGAYIASDLAQLAKVSGIPVVVSVHDTNPDLIYDSLKYADYIICTSSAVKSVVLEKFDFDAGKVWIMPNRIDENIMKRTVDRDKFEKLNKRFKGNKHVLHIGRKAEQKNIDTVIRSMKYLDDDVTAVFLGMGDFTLYQKIAADEGVSDRCYFVESVNKEELPVWYSWCDCFCTPSRWEGFGNVFVEAAACEAAIVTSDIAPMNEYLTHMLDAILVCDYENPRAIAFAIKEVLTGGEKIESMKKNARYVGLRFEKKRIDEQEIQIYKNVIDKGADSKRLSHEKIESLQRKYRKYEK